MGGDRRDRLSTFRDIRQPVGYLANQNGIPMAKLTNRQLLLEILREDGLPATLKLILELVTVTEVTITNDSVDEATLLSDFLRASVQRRQRGY